MNNNPYMRNYNPNYNNFNQQSMYEQIDNQISQLQQMREQMRNNQQPAINQTFQITPTNHTGMRYANTIDDVSKEQIFSDTPFFSKDMSVLWVKNAQGEVKTYELNEIVPKDEKDLQIELLIAQIEELKGMIKNDAHVRNVDESKTTTNTTRDDEPTRTTTEKSESTSIQRIPTSNKGK